MISLVGVVLCLGRASGGGGLRLRGRRAGQKASGQEKLNGNPQRTPADDPDHDIYFPFICTRRACDFTFAPAQKPERISLSCGLMIVAMRPWRRP
jgi:hypothetical protein